MDLNEKEEGQWVKREKRASVIGQNLSLRKRRKEIVFGRERR